MTWEEAVLWLRGQPDQVELVRAGYYDDPLTEAAERYRASTEWQALRTFLPPPPVAPSTSGRAAGSRRMPSHAKAGERTLSSPTRAPSWAPRPSAHWRRRRESRSR